MFGNLKKEVLEGNLLLSEYNLVTFTWGNVSGIDRKSGLVVIKPSGVSYQNLKESDLVIVDLEGRIVEGDLNPSSDTATHLEIYQSFPEIGGIVHTHSSWCTAWAQSGKSIPVFGTTQADHFYGEIPCTRKMKKEEIEGEYEKETGRVIVETFKGKDPKTIPGVLVNNHGPFCWGEDALKAVKNAVIMEEVAKMAFHTLILKPDIRPITQELLDKHFLRKHGENAYYGQ